ncbi:MAG TPA: ferritin-like domain-containing protein, partial [Nitrospira sp.]|nr:ferritin-like domain-containing protein [Nitrospira sp.]
YLLHAALCKNWGYERLHDQYSHLANEEVQHSAGLIDHILYLDGTPEVGELDTIAQGRDVGALFRADLDFERDDVELLRKAIAHCAKVGDFTTRHLLEHMIEDSEEHVDWFEIRLKTINQVGLDRFLSEQIKK